MEGEVVVVMASCSFCRVAASLLEYAGRRMYALLSIISQVMDTLK